MSDCLFCRIATGEIPADVVLATEDVLAFRDITPQAPTHVLVIPKQHFVDAAELISKEPALAAKVLAAATSVAQSEQLSAGYRIVTNTGPAAGQSVQHVHFHLLGGRDMAWPPG